MSHFDGINSRQSRQNVTKAPSFCHIDALAFGCPAMGAEELEEMEFAPMWDEAEPHLGSSKVALFGSYDWAVGEWMDLWEQRANDAGVNVFQTLIAKDYPDDEASAACVAMGKALAE